MNSFLFFGEHDIQEAEKGICFLSKPNQLGQAMEAFQDCLRRNPNNVAALFGLGLISRATRRWEQCFYYFEEALLKDPRNWAVLIELSISYLRLNHQEKLLRMLDKVLFLLRGTVTPSMKMYFYKLLSEVLSVTSRDLPTSYSLLLVEVLESFSPIDADGESFLELDLLYGSLFSLYHDDIHKACSKLKKSLQMTPAVRLGDSARIVSIFLKQNMLGYSSRKSVFTFVKSVDTLFSDALEIDTLDPTAMNWVLCLLCQVRSANLVSFLNNHDVNLKELGPDLIIHMLLFSPLWVANAFCKTPADQWIREKPFFAISSVCFLKDPQDEAWKDATNPICARLKSLNIQEMSELEFQLHQASFNLISCGQRVLGCRFVHALALVHEIYFGAVSPFYNNGFFYLNVDWVSAFGHVVFLELLLRAEKLELGPAVPRTISFFQREAANASVSALLLHNGFQVQESTIESESRRWQMDYVVDEKNQVHYFMDYFNLIQAKLLDRSSTTVLQIPNSWMDEGLLLLDELNVSKQARICVFHCRESSYWTNVYNCFLNARNAEVDSYLPLIHSLLKKGFVVFRIGDKGMSPLCLGDHEFYFDTTQWKDKPPWFDFFIFNRAQLFLGTNSGPAGVANVFGTPCLLTNWFPVNVHIANLNPKNLIMPKMVRLGDRFATLDELMLDPLSSTDFVAETEAQNLVENTAQDLHKALEEMLDRLAGTFEPDPAISAMEVQIQAVWAKYMPWNITFPHSFLRKYGKSLLGSEEQTLEALLSEGIKGPGDQGP